MLRTWPLVRIPCSSLDPAEDSATVLLMAALLQVLRSFYIYVSLFSLSLSIYLFPSLSLPFGKNYVLFFGSSEGLSNCFANEWQRSYSWRAYTLSFLLPCIFEQRMVACGCLKWRLQTLNLSNLTSRIFLMNQFMVSFNI